MSRYSSFSTDVREVAEEFLSEAYADGRLRLPADPGFCFANERFDGVSFKLDEMEFGAAASFTFEPQDVYIVNQIARGRVRVRQPGVEEMLTRGELSMVGRPGVETTADADGAFLQHLVTLDAPALREAAGLDADQELPSFASIRPISAARAASWRRAVNYVGAMLRGDPGIAEAPLVVGSANRLLAGITLATFPNDAIASPERRVERDARSTTALRRAVAFIDASADLDIGIADIAAAAGASRRSIQLAFRRHLDTTPTDYLRRVRLDGAHRELLGASPGDPLTVTEVAYRWGFSSPSRFAERYRAAFGRSPRETLRG
jgi:AraC-like DNA-binding protein